MWVDKKKEQGCKPKCSPKKLLHRHVPITKWLPTYTMEALISDLVAGVTVGLTVIPQSMAYAAIAGLGPHYGLYAGFIGCFVYIFLGSCKDITIGPTAVMGLLTYENTHKYGPEFAVMLCFMTGFIEMLLGIFHMGFCVDFISIPVTSGFTSAAALTIVSSQLKPLLGLRVKSQGFLDTLKVVGEHITETRVGDAVLGFICIAILLGLRKIKDVKLGGEEPTKFQKIVNRGIWILSISRNALMVLVCAVIAFVLENNGKTPFILTGPIEAGLPTFQPPPFGYERGNFTLSYMQIIQQMGGGAIVTSLIAILQNVAISKAFSNGGSVDATQEMIALGACNLLGSFVSSLPVSGSFSRSAVNNSSGVKTTLGGLYTGALVLLALAFLTPYFFYIPKASLAAVIISAVIFMVEFQVLKPIWRCNKLDLIPALVTFLCCLFLGMEYGIMIGVAVNLFFVLYAAARPKVHVEKIKSDGKLGFQYLLVTPDRSLSFPSVDHVCTAISKAAMKQADGALPVILDCHFIHGGDFTTAKGLESLVSEFKKRQQVLLFWNMKPSVAQLAKGVLLSDKYLVDGNRQELESIIQETAYECITDDEAINSKDILLPIIISKPSSSQQSLTQESDHPLIDNGVLTKSVTPNIDV